MDNIIKIDLIDDTSKIDVELTDYNDKEVRDDIEELRQTKVDKIEGKGLSTNDYTTTEKTKLASLENYDDSEVRALIDTKQPRGNYITQETDPTVPNHVKNITQNNINTWNNKQNALVSGTNIKTINEQSILGSGNLEIEGVTNYSELSNKPQINNVELNGNKTSSDLGLQPAGNYITNTDYASNSTGGVVKTNTNYGTSVDSNGSFRGTTKTYEDYGSMHNLGLISKVTLENVITGKGLTTSTDLATKQNITDNTLTTTNKTIPTAINEVNSIAKGANQAVGYSNYSAMITAINAMDDDEYNVGQNLYVVTVNVPDLWVSSVESTSSTYTYVDDATFVSALETNGYVQVGYYKLSMLETQKVDLTNYVTNTDYGSFATAGVVKASSTYGTQFASTGAIYAQTKTYEQYTNSTSPGLFISKGTLENVITGKGLVSNDDLTDYVKNTDFANNTTAGVIRTSTNYGTTVSGSGVINASTLSYEAYTGANNTTFVGKGTLENVIEGKNLVNNTDYATSSKGGVIKTGASYGTTMASAGTLRAVIKTYEDYSSAGSSMFIGKGTLENVIAGKELNLKQLSTFDATKTQVLKNINGTLTWVDE